MIMITTDFYKPIKNFGYFLTAVGICGFLVLFTKLTDIKYLMVVWIFIGLISLYHLLLGIGVILKKKWAFGIFKSYLRLLYLGFPIGTYISRKTMRYIDENSIEKYLK